MLYLISAEQQSDSVIHIYIYILFHSLFHYGLLQNIEYSSLCYILRHWYLSALYVIVCIC